MLSIQYMNHQISPHRLQMAKYNKVPFRIAVKIFQFMRFCENLIPQIVKALILNTN